MKTVQNLRATPKLRLKAKELLAETNLTSLSAEEKRKNMALLSQRLGEALLLLIDD